MSRLLQNALEALYGLERRRDKHDLQGTRVLLHALGHPQRRFRSIHVAGTNGKGTVCALVERVLREAGFRTGLYTSPHLVDFRERIRVRGRWADEGWLEAALARIAALPEGRDRTFFEVATALAFDHFAAHGVEVAVVEVGLGGRLDCTNVLEPEVTVITSIGLDHTEILGDTPEAIAAEKAGIVKPGVPLIVGPLADGPRAVVERIASGRGAPLLGPAVCEGAGRGLLARDTPWGELVLAPAIAGVGAGANAGLALAALAAFARAGHAIPAAAVRDGFAAARWPGRFERCPGEPRLWWDGAHNAPGAAALAAGWAAAGLPAPGALVLALSRDKDLDAVLAPLAALVRGGVVVATRSRSERALDPEAISAAARAAGLTARVAPDVATACRAALREAAGDTPVLLAGSLFAVGEAMETFGGAPGELL